MTIDHDTLRGWLTGRLPDDWFTGPVTLELDRDEITVIGPLAPPPLAPEAADAERAAAVRGRVKEFRERTREQRMEVARELQHRTGRTVSWGVQVGDHRELFTTLSAPVMTRLRQPERQVLDTLVEAGVARSRSDALAWCVRLVAKNSDTWLADLRGAMEHVAKVRAEGPHA
ncbi:MAG TPA: hypothetical protein VMI11_15160 [Actinomycetes bacterium]|nr:hypothetical protein [Actinomycetes bacterium]